MLVFAFFRLVSAIAISDTVHNISDVGIEFDCVPTGDWISTGYVASDCRQTIRRFIHEEVFHMDEELEFLAPGSAPIHTLPTIETPRRYSVGLSTLPMHLISLNLLYRNLTREL